MSTRSSTRRSAGRCRRHLEVAGGRRRVQPAGRLHRPGDHVAARPRHPGERPGQHVMVVVKIVDPVFFIVAALTAFHTGNFTPFSRTAPAASDGRRAHLLRLHRLRRRGHRLGGVREPGSDLPIAIVGSLVISTILYILVAIAAVGVAPITLTAQGTSTPAGGRAQGGRRDPVGRRRARPRRADRDHQRRPGDHVRPDPDLLRHVPRRPAAASFAGVTRASAPRPG